ncbi:MAG: hypothetical protein U5K75_02470 [Ahrensia sp.]|nr:hypothetical protein [Ahrensia sp.]
MIRIQWLGHILKRMTDRKVLSTPDLIIGGAEDPYMRRWFIIPRNRWFNIYLHEIVRSDDDRALHDHPWWSLSLVLDGQMLEVLPISKTDIGHGFGFLSSW